MAHSNHSLALKKRGRLMDKGTEFNSVCKTIKFHSIPVQEIFRGKEGLYTRDESTGLRGEEGVH